MRKARCCRRVDIRIGVAASNNCNFLKVIIWQLHLPPWRWISRQTIFFTDFLQHNGWLYREHVWRHFPDSYDCVSPHFMAKTTRTREAPRHIHTNVALEKTHQKNSHLGKETASPQMAFSTTGSWDKSSRWLLWVEWGGWIHQHQLKGPGDRINRAIGID